MDTNDQPELKLVTKTGRPDEEVGSPKDEEGRGHGDLVADVIRQSGLLPGEKVDRVEGRAAGASFSQALIDEGLAGALGIARTLAARYHLPLVDLAVAGVDTEAVKAIALPVLTRVAAIPFATDGSKLKVAITDPQ